MSVSGNSPEPEDGRVLGVLTGQVKMPEPDEDPDDDEHDA